MGVIKVKNGIHRDEVVAGIKLGPEAIGEPLLIRAKELRVILEFSFHPAPVNISGLEVWRIRKDVDELELVASEMGSDAATSLVVKRTVRVSVRRGVFPKEDDGWVAVAAFLQHVLNVGEIGVSPCG